MPIPPPVNYQIVPIRHNNSYYRTPTKSLQNLNSFVSRRGSVDDNNNSSNSRYGTLRNAEERRSPYYYNELTRMHATNQQQFLLNESRIQSPQHFDSAGNDESFIDFINTINVENISWAFDKLWLDFIDVLRHNTFVDWIDRKRMEIQLARWGFIRGFCRNLFESILQNLMKKLFELEIIEHLKKKLFIDNLNKNLF